MICYRFGSTVSVVLACAVAAALFEGCGVQPQWSTGASGRRYEVLSLGHSDSAGPLFPRLGRHTFIAYRQQASSPDSLAAELEDVATVAAPAAEASGDTMMIISAVQTVGAGSLKVERGQMVSFLRTRRSGWVRFRLPPAPSSTR